MTHRHHTIGVFVAGICLCVVAGSALYSQTPSQPPAAVQKQVVTAMHASGTFDVKVSPQATDEKPGGSTLGRMSLDKQFHGDLEGTSKGEMLTAGTSAVKDSAGYVAIERVTGTLKGRTGTFVLQHSGTMTRGAPSLTITVVPDTGTDQLVGLTGAMTITITGGKHLYEFHYMLPGTP